MSYACSVKTYLEDEHPKALAVFKKACIRLNKTKYIILPSDKEIVELTKMLKTKPSVKDSKTIIREAKATLYSYILKDPIIEGQKSKEVSTAAKDGVLHLSDVKGGKFTVLTGKKGEVKAECVIVDVVRMPSMKDGDEGIKMCICKAKSGKIAYTTKDDMKMKGGCPDEKVLVGSDMLQIRKVIFDDLMMRSKATGKDHFTPALSGLLKTCNMSGNNDSCKFICKFLYPCAVATLAVLLQPNGGSECLIDDTILKKWCGAPYFCDDHDKYRRLFIEKYCKDKPEVERSSIISKFSEFATDKSWDEFLKFYESNMNKVFPSGYHADKRWADEVASHICSIFMKNEGSMDEKMNMINEKMNYFKGLDKENETFFREESSIYKLKLNRDETSNYVSEYINTFLLYVPTDKLYCKDVATMSRFIESTVRLNMKLKKFEKE